MSKKFQMVGTINMQEIRYINLFGRITKVDTHFCFPYNSAIIFCVPKPLMSKAIGEKGKNVKYLGEILSKKIKVIPLPKGINDANNFIRAIVSPVMFKELEVRDNELVLTAGNQNKAALIGRNKRRFLEMQKIIKDFFGKEFRIV